MSKIVHYIGLGVHKVLRRLGSAEKNARSRRPGGRERTSPSIAVSIAPQNSTEVRRYGLIGGTLDAVDKPVKKLAQHNIELRFVCEAGPRGFVLCHHLLNRGIPCEVIAPSLIPKKASDRVKTDRRDFRDTNTDHPRLHVRCGKGGKDRFLPLSLVMVAALREWWKTHRHPTFLVPGPTFGWRER